LHIQHDRRSLPPVGRPNPLQSSLPSTPVPPSPAGARRQRARPRSAECGTNSSSLLHGHVHGESHPFHTSSPTFPSASLSDNDNERTLWRSTPCNIVWRCPREVTGSSPTAARAGRSGEVESPRSLKGTTRSERAGGFDDDCDISFFENRKGISFLIILSTIRVSAMRACSLKIEKVSSPTMSREPN
jgi:hypothetical protein